MEKIEVVPLHREAASRIREMIRKGKLVKGQKIIEAELARAIGVSRTPLREALRVLSAEGLIEVVPNKGAYVSEPSPGEIRDMFEVMSVLEGTCARMAALKMTPSALKKLENLHAKLEKHFASGDREGYIAVNNQYHELVQALAGNSILSDTVNGLRDKVLLHRYRQIFEDKRFEESMSEHRRIIEAFKMGDPEEAERQMREHLIRQGEALIGAINRNKA